MELTVSGGISHHSPKMVHRSKVRPLTQCITKVLTQHSHNNRKRPTRLEMAIKSSQKNTELSFTGRKHQQERAKFAKRLCFCFFLHVTQLTGNTLKAFFLLGSLWSPPSLTSFNWINEQVRPDLSNIYLLHIRYFAESLSVQVMLELLITLLFHLKGNKNSALFFFSFLFLKQQSIMIELLLRPCLPNVGLWMNAIVLYSSQQSDVEQAQQDGGLTTWHWQTEKHPHQRGTKAVYTRFSSGQTHFQHNVDVGLPLCTVECTSVMLQCCSITCCWLYHPV